MLVIFVTSWRLRGRNSIGNMLLYVVLGSKILAVEMYTAQHYCKGNSKGQRKRKSQRLTYDEHFMTHSDDLQELRSAA